MRRALVRFHSMSFATLRDLKSFAEQIVPSPLGILLPYLFAPDDLPDAPSSSSSAVLATFDVLSYNLNHEAVRDPARRRRILRAIRSSGADVALLQETNRAWEEALRGEGEDVGEDDDDASLSSALSSARSVLPLFRPELASSASGGGGGAKLSSPSSSGSSGYLNSPSAPSSYNMPSSR